MKTRDFQLDELHVDIARLSQHIDDREVLLEVLEQDGHNVSEQEVALQKDRSRLAVMISRQLAPRVQIR